MKKLSRSDYRKIKRRFERHGCDAPTDEQIDAMTKKADELHMELDFYINLQTQHEFYPRTDFTDLCAQCGKQFEHDNHC